MCGKSTSKLPQSMQEEGLLALRIASDQPFFRHLRAAYPATVSVSTSKLQSIFRYQQDHDPFLRNSCEAQ